MEYIVVKDFKKLGIPHNHLSIGDKVNISYFKGGLFTVSFGMVNISSNSCMYMVLIDKKELTENFKTKQEIRIEKLKHL